ncbi:MAG: diguanylate cyclase [Phycisphaerae bacterium]
MRVLIAEDEPVSRRLLEGTLSRWGYDVLVACDGDQAWESFTREPDPPRLAIFDWMMPGMDGIELCRQIRKEARDEYTYIILLTAKNRKENLIQGLDAGADDYITKPFDSDELEVRIRAARRIIDLQAKLLDAQEALRKQATHDPLTELLNRGAILETISRELARVDRESRPLGVMLADIDHFKYINDSFGHRAGDAALRQVSQRMVHNLRNYDSVGRYGGEEFLAVLPGLDENSALGRAEKFRQAVAERPIEIPGRTLPLTISVGVAVVSPGDDLHLERLVHRADEAMYEAKAAGRNQVVLAEPGPRACTQSSAS